MNIEWTITGIILLGGMTAGGISLYLKKRREAKLADSRKYRELIQQNPDFSLYN